MSDRFEQLRQRLPKPEAFRAPEQPAPTQGHDDSPPCGLRRNHEYDSSPPLSQQGGRPRTRRATPTVRLHRQLARDSYWTTAADIVWARFILTKLRHRARTLGTPCDLTKEDMLALLDESQMQCPAFGVDLILGRGTGHSFLPNAAAADRIDPSRPFTKVNMVVLSAKAKAARAMLTADEMTALATFAQQMKASHGPATSV